MNRLELRMKYKEDTAQSSEPITCYARCAKDFTIIIDSEDCDERITQMLAHNGKQTEISFPDPEYHKWLEETLMELLK